MNRSRRIAGRLLALLLLVAGLGLVVSGPATAAQHAASYGAGLPSSVDPADGTCAQSYLPVSLGQGRPANQQVWVQLCLPLGATPKTVQLLVHGCLYNGSYWEFPDPTGGTDRYNYVDHALAAGYATLDFDMVGAGRSSHPVSTELNVPAGVWIIHELVQALRSGAIAGPNGKQAFSKVIEVSHSFGTFFAWEEVSEYDDVNAVIFTGATHHLDIPGTPFLTAISHFEPALFDSEFSSTPLDPGYLTLSPSERDLFYEPAAADPAVIAADTAHGDVLTATELADFPIVLATPLNIRVPVLLVLGQDDPMFCARIATDCSSAQAVAAQERRFLGTHVPSLDAYLLPGSGHDLNLMPNATQWFDYAQSWAARTVPAS